LVEHFLGHEIWSFPSSHRVVGIIVPRRRLGSLGAFIQDFAFRQLFGGLPEVTDHMTFILSLRSRSTWGAEDRPIHLAVTPPSRH
jgi:hypothetical protein